MLRSRLARVLPQLRRSQSLRACVVDRSPARWILRRLFRGSMMRCRRSVYGSRALLSLLLVSRYCLVECFWGVFHCFSSQGPSSLTNHPPTHHPSSSAHHLSSSSSSQPSQYYSAYSQQAQAHHSPQNCPRNPSFQAQPFSPIARPTQPQHYPVPRRISETVRLRLSRRSRHRSTLSRSPSAPVLRNLSVRASIHR